MSRLISTRDSEVQLKPLIAGLAVAALLACRGDVAEAPSELAAGPRFGCYVIYLGDPDGWLPAAWRTVDTTSADQLRVLLTAAVSPVPLIAGPDDVIDGVPVPVFYRWEPTERGMRILYDGHHPFRIDLAGDSVDLRGTGVAQGESRRPVRARRVPCSDGTFTPGFKSPDV